MDITNLQNMSEIVTKYRQDIREGKPTEWANKIFLCDNIANEFHREFKRQLKTSDYKRHVYMLTYTIDPNKYKENADEIEEYINRQHTRTALKIEQYQVVKEFCKNGMPHWHALVVTTKPLKKDRFNYYISKYGNIDISKNKAQETAEILNYMTKSGEIQKHK